MTIADRLSFLLHLFLYALALIMVIRAFGRPAQHELAWHLRRQALQVVGPEDAVFVLKSKKPMSSKQFDQLVEQFPNNFQVVE